MSLLFNVMRASAKINSQPYDLARATYNPGNVSVTAQETAPCGVAFSSDGTKMFVVGTTADTVFQYTLAMPWVVRTASYDSVSFSVAAQNNAPQSVSFSSDGTKMFILGSSIDIVFQYTLPTPWSLVGASYDTISLAIGAQESVPASVSFSSDGTKMYAMGSNTDTIYQYTLPTPWSLVGASYASISLSVAAQDTSPVSASFSADGTKMFVLGFTNDTIYQYSLPTPWVLTGGSYDSVSMSVTIQDSSPQDIVFSPDGMELYMVGITTDRVYQYTLPAPYDIAGFVQSSVSVAAQDSAPTGVVFSRDGSKMYMIGPTADAVYQYTLSTPWRVSSASYDSISFSVAAQEITPQALAFSRDGTRMYVTGTTGATVYQYTLSTPWDLSTASYASLSFSVAAQELTPSDLVFSADGTKLFILGFTTDAVYQYTLVTPWAINTAAYDAVSLSVAAQDLTPTGMAISADGSKLYMIGTSNDAIYQYTLPTPWSLAAASYDAVSLSIAAQDTAPVGLTFSTDNTKMYVAGAASDRVYQYGLEAA